jgi:hypothetical protein
VQNDRQKNTEKGTFTMKRPMKTALWCDCENDHERAEFIKSGRAVATGVMAPAVQQDVEQAFYKSHILRLVEADAGIDWILTLVESYRSNHINAIALKGIRKMLDELHRHKSELESRL